MKPEFSRLVAIDQLPARGHDLEIAASAAERAALARRFAILGIDRLDAKLRLKPIGRGPLVRLSGTVSAEVVQACVVSLEPVRQSVDEAFEMTFGPDVDNGGEAEIDLDLDAEDPPDPIVDGEIDVGEAVAEQVALALDPFPRADGAVFTPPAEAAPEEAETANPFAALILRRKNDV
jgi:uncharacterized metal-binding protein YceD (DUF177 family)